MQTLRYQMLSLRIRLFAVTFAVIWTTLRDNHQTPGSAACFGQTPGQIPGQSLERSHSHIPINPSESSASKRRLSQAESAQLLMQSALLHGVWGPPVHCLIAQEIRMLDRQLHGSGEYWRGQSLGEMKLNLKVVAGDHLNILHQVSDGRILKTLRNIDGTKEGSRVELERVWKYLGRFDKEKDREDPMVAIHLAIGGQNEKLRALCQQYSWSQVQSGKWTPPTGQAQGGQAQGGQAQVDVWWLRGQRAQSPSTFRGLSEIDGSLAAVNQSTLVPDQATIALGRTAPLQYWLYHVEESRREKSEQNLGQLSVVCKIDYYQPTIVRDLPETIFEDNEIYSSPEVFVDETRKYIPPNRVPERVLESQTAARIP